MSLFRKCRELVQRIDSLKSAQQYFYLRELDPAADPVVHSRGRRLIMLGSNNYLGLTTHPQVIKAATEALHCYGTGCSSSRLLTGNTSLHARLEQELALFKGTEDAVLFSSGFATMSGTIAALAGKGDIIFSDELNHASIIDGCRMAEAEVKVYRHRDMPHLAELLAAAPPEAEKLIVTDGVFSMKGTVADLPAIRRLADEYGARMMVDDAHGTGVLGAAGRGTPEHFGLEGKIDLICGTFSKSFGAVGGFTGAGRDVVTFLKHTSRPFIFSASLPPPVVAGVLACLAVMKEEPQRLERLRENTDFLRNGLRQLGFPLEETITPIIPLLIGDEERVFRMTGLLEERGVIVNPVVAPAVSSENALIRVSVMASLSRDHLEQALERFRDVGREVGVIV